jgi:hypothetical protein
MPRRIAAHEAKKETAAARRYGGRSYDQADLFIMNVLSKQANEARALKFR